jgi:PIN domain nuclease of toxin-antitoxin system
MLNLDTHMIVFLLAGELSARENQLIQENDIAISDIVLWELCKLVQLKRVEFDLQSTDFHSLLLNLNLFPITLEIGIASTQLDFRGDPADEIIAATSIIEGIRLLTRDRRIRKSRKVPLA